MRHSERGTAMVEFAFATLALFMFVFGIFEFGRVLFTYHTVSNAARLGTRWAIVRGASCTAPLDHCNAAQADVLAYVKSQVVGVMDPSRITVDVSWPGTGACANSNARGCPVSVTVHYPFVFALPLVSSQALTVSSTSQMTVSN